MIAYIYNRNNELVGEIDAAVRCGDYCDKCGDCLFCYGDDYCPDGFHRWVLYEDMDMDKKRIAEITPPPVGGD